MSRNKFFFSCITCLGLTLLCISHAFGMNHNTLEEWKEITKKQEELQTFSEKKDSHKTLRDTREELYKAQLLYLKKEKEHGHGNLEFLKESHKKEVDETTRSRLRQEVFYLKDSLCFQKNRFIYVSMLVDEAKRPETVGKRALLEEALGILRNAKASQPEEDPKYCTEDRKALDRQIVHYLGTNNEQLVQNPTQPPLMQFTRYQDGSLGAEFNYTIGGINIHTELARPANGVQPRSVQG